MERTPLPPTPTPPPTTTTTTSTTSTTTTTTTTTTGLDDLLCSGRSPASQDNIYACQWNNEDFIQASIILFLRL